MTNKTNFHLSLPCNDIEQTKQFYIEDLGFDLGRKGSNWFDVDLYGHQLTFTQAGKFDFNNPNYVFDNQLLPSFHFGIILDSDEWEELYKRFSAWNIKVTTQVTFLEDKPGEHNSFFVNDPNGFLIEFKSFTKEDSIFLE